MTSAPSRLKNIRGKYSTPGPGFRAATWAWHHSQTHAVHREGARPMPERSGTGLGGNAPTVLRIMLGTQLRRLREARGITAQAAAKAIRGSESKISRIE